jgi:hypothetical protein
MRKLCTDEVVGGVRMEKNEKNKKMFCNLKKNVFSFKFLFGCSFGFVFQR